MTALVLALHLVALAEDDRVRVVFVRDDGADACPDDDALRERVRQRIGSEPFRDDDEGREVRVGIARAEGGLVARIVLFSQKGKRLGVRALRGATDCAALSNDLVLAVAIAIDPLLLVRGRAPPPPPVVPVAPVAVAPLEPVHIEPSPSSPPVAVATHDIDIPSPAAVYARAALGVSAGVGTAPSPSTRVEASFNYGILDLDAGVRFDIPSRTPVVPGAVVDTALVAARGAACLETALDPNVTARGCGTLEAGAFVAQGVGFAVGRAVTAPWVAVGAGGGLVVHPWPELGLILAGDVTSPLVRPRLIDDVTRQVYLEPALFGWDLTLGAQVQIR